MSRLVLRHRSRTWNVIDSEDGIIGQILYSPSSEHWFFRHSYGEAGWGSWRDFGTKSAALKYAKLPMDTPLIVCRDLNAEAKKAKAAMA